MTIPTITDDSNIFKHIIDEWLHILLCALKGKGLPIQVMAVIIKLKTVFHLKTFVTISQIT